MLDASDHSAIHQMYLHVARSTRMFSQISAVDGKRIETKQINLTTFWKSQIDQHC